MNAIVFALQNLFQTRFENLLLSGDSGRWTQHKDALLSDFTKALTDVINWMNGRLEVKQRGCTIPKLPLSTFVLEWHTMELSKTPLFYFFFFFTDFDCCKHYSNAVIYSQNLWRKKDLLVVCFDILVMLNVINWERAKLWTLEWITLFGSGQ